MEDSQIIKLYFSRSESAIKETERKYGTYCYSIANNILENHEDSEEIVSDTYLSAWNAIPPHVPKVLAAFLGRITRQLSIDRLRKYQTFKRGSGTLTAALEELGECVSGKDDVESAVYRKELMASIRRFLEGLTATERSMFVCRYWYLDSTEEIARKSGCSVSKVKSMLYRIRKRLDAHLEKEGYR